MRKIRFIRALAFVLSVIIRIIAIPVVLFQKLLEKCQIRKKEKPDKKKKEKKESKIRLALRENNSIPVRILKKLDGLLQRCKGKVYAIWLKVKWSIYAVRLKCSVKCSVHRRHSKREKHVIQSAYLELFLTFIKEYVTKEKAEFICAGIGGVKEFVKRHKDKAVYRIVEPEQMRTVCIPEVFEKGEEKLEHYMSPDIYIAELSDVTIIGGSNVIVADGVFLNDSVYYDTEKRVDIRYSAIKKVIDDVAIIENVGEPEIFDRGINLVGAASYNYYHLLIELLSKIAYVDSYSEYRSWPLLVDEVVLRVPQFATALNYANKYQHPIKKIEKEKQYIIQKMLLPSATSWMPTNVYYRDDFYVSDFIMAESALNNVRSATGVWTEKKAWRKIFVSRKNTQTVRLKNEEAVRDVFAKNGFEIVYTEEMSFEQQIECFGQASCVVAATGAALANMVFCQPNTVIGCIIPAYEKFYMYSTMAHLLKLKPVFLDAEIVELTPWIAMDSFVLDLEYAKRYIRYIEKLC